jgi:hypothetical protein
MTNLLADSCLIQGYKINVYMQTTLCSQRTAFSTYLLDRKILESVYGMLILYSIILHKMISDALYSENSDKIRKADGIIGDKFQTVLKSIY